jgi:hypothetical protein
MFLTRRRAPLCAALCATAASLIGCGARTSLPDGDAPGEPTGAGGGAGTTSASSSITGAGGAWPGPCVPGEGPVRIASGQMGPQRLAVDATYVYWTDHDIYSGRVMTAPLAGGSAQEIAASQQRPRGIAVDEERVYWTDTLAGLVQQAFKDGSGLEALGPWQHNPEYVAASASGTFWTNRGSVSDGQILRAGAGGSLPVELTGGQHEPAEIAADGSHVYWINNHSPGAGPGSLRRIGVEGGAVEVLLEGVVNARGLSMDTTHLYFASVGSGPKFDLVQVPKAGGQVTILAADVSPRALAVDDTFVYLAENEGRISRVPKSGGSPVTIAQSGMFLHGIVADASCVYWTVDANGQQSHDGEVWRAPKQ